MTKTTKRIFSIVTVLSIMLCSFYLFTGTTAGAATDRVNLYSAETYFCKYGVTGTYVYVQTKDNASNQKVTVHYNYMKGYEWQDSEAEYFTTLEDGSKLWKAYISSYNTEYAIKYVADGVTIWDNNNGKNYKTERIGTAPITANRTNFISNHYQTVIATLQNYAYVKDVKVRYTTNNWASYKDVAMNYSSTNEDGTEQWTASLNDYIQDLSSFQYCISYTVNGRTYWANNFGQNYNASYRVYP